MKFSALSGKVCLAAAAAGSLLISFSTGIARAEKVIATIPVASPPGEPGIDPVLGRVYVPNNNQISVIDENTNRLIHTITIGVSLGGVAFNPITSVLYAVDPVEGLVYAINSHTYRVVATIPVPYGVYIAVNPISGRIYVSDNMFYITVIDGSTNKVVATIAVDSLHCLAVNMLTNRIYAAQGHYPGQVVVIDGGSDQVVATVPTGGNDPFAIGVDYFRNLVYATNANSVAVIDGSTNTLRSTVPLSTELGGIAIDPVVNRIYVNNEFTNQVEIINGANDQPAGSVSVGDSPFLSAIDFYRGLLYVGDFGVISNEGPWIDSAVSVVRLPASVSPATLASPTAALTAP